MTLDPLSMLRPIGPGAYHYRTEEQRNREDDEIFARIAAACWERWQREMGVIIDRDPGDEDPSTA